ncbi:NAD(+) diphosphatase [Cryobacterium sp. BB307]|uniref:NAD(+) diphosphatase n=1 Tax=Cryobacterium sp. BB307 TaxID=2716317 RepID=UPI0014482E1B|nr:NAD(+) diphosphatase [Cryobacterium sp. BB307]
MGHTELLPPTPRLTNLPLARGDIDRDNPSRSNPELLGQLMADERTRVLAISRARGLIAEDGPRLQLLPPAEIPDAAVLVYLGRSIAERDGDPSGTPLVAAVLADEIAADFAPDERWGSLRAVGAELDHRDAGLLVEAVAMAHWHSSHRFSPLTGQPLTPEQAGWVLRSADDTIEIFPRTDPAVIVAVTDADNRLLLGSNALWEVNRYSLLAGYVEPGESLEAAVAREVFEESGVRVIDPVYLGSQPWPFPQSLMIGFQALADPNQDWETTADGIEILDLRWFTRDQLRDARDIILPGRTSIARSIIEHWLGEPLGDDR